MSTTTTPLLAPSATFRKQATRSVIAITAFILVYFILLALSLLLAGAAFYAGVAILTVRISFLTIVGGLGIMACGGMILFFMIKFLFSSHKEDRSDSIEITEEDQPELFRTIYELAEQTGTPRPKHVFISADVNAAVFYDSSFWSMFLPIRKNLKIGLGLVNSVNVSELKAVIAHEFGHFSQKSMKVGSWVYGVNRIIYDMLYNNSSYSKALGTVGSLDGLLAILTGITVKIVQGIMWVLHQMYRVVNKSYMGLSREMEFHADLVAASVCGSNNVINALKRIEFGEVCYGTTINTCNNVWREKKVVSDFYAQHRTVVRHLAPLNGLQLVNDLPLIKENNEGQVRPRVNYHNQWSSHPTLAERERHLEPFGLSTAVEETTAWSLFQNEVRLKEELTSIIYKAVPPEEIQGNIDVTEFESRFRKELESTSFPKIFGKFYENRVVKFFDPDAVSKQPFTRQSFTTLLNEEQMLLPSRLRCLDADISVLQAIVDKKIETSSFDFEGKKYPRKQAKQVLAQLEGEKSMVEKQIDDLDTILFRYFYAVQPLAEAEAYKECWKEYFHYRRLSEEFIETISRMMAPIAPIFEGQALNNDDIASRIAGVKQNYEPAFKKALTEWKTLGAFEKDNVLTASIEKFLQSDYAYFTGTEFFDTELVELNTLVQDSLGSVFAWVQDKFHGLTVKQEEIEKAVERNREMEKVG